MLTVKRPTQAAGSKPVVQVQHQRLTVDLDAELHRQLKVQAALESRTMTNIVRAACERYVAAQEG